MQTAVESYLAKISQLDTKIKASNKVRAAELEAEKASWQRKIDDIMRTRGGLTSERAAHEGLAAEYDNHK